MGLPFFFGKTWKGTLREIFFFRKIPLRFSFGCFSFSEKQIRDDFNVTFSLVRKSNQKRRFLRSFCFCKKNQKADARTRQKLPVASFGVSETAETGSIVSGREQDDHVSRSRLRPATSVQNSERGDYILSRKSCGYQRILREF